MSKDGEAALQIALAELGQAEVPGKGSNKRIDLYAERAGYTPSNGDEDPWCGNFQAFVWSEFGAPLPEAPWRARSWMKWGVDARKKPSRGDVVVFPRGVDPDQGHVTQIDVIEGSFAYCIGGNQKNKVGRERYDLREALAIRRVDMSHLTPVSRALKTSTTVRGAVIGFFGAVLQFGEATFRVLIEAAGRLSELKVVEPVLHALGANIGSIGFGLATYAVVQVLYSRLDAAAKGKVA